MKVAFDLDAALRNPFSGFYTFGRGLLHGMEGLEKRPDMLLVYQRRYRERADSLMAGLGSWAYPVQVNFRFRWLQAVWSRVNFPDFSIFAGEYDLFHSFHNFIPPRCRRPSILTVHDLRRYVMPEMYPKSKVERFEEAVARADHFIAVSGATRDDLSRFFDIRKEKIDVVHLACDYIPLTMKEAEREEVRQTLLDGGGVDFEKFFVTISSGDKRKNISGTVEAFNLAVPYLGDGIGLVILGRLPDGLSIADGKHIFRTGTVDDVMPWIACSEGLVFPSLYEGFGLPVLEGFAASVPVITSNRSSMPEVAGGAAMLVDPEDSWQIASAMVEIVSSKEKTMEMVRAGHRRLADFSWKDSAEKTVDVYRKVLDR
jgi:glycosyltransferase involved in cell wall biosynthesis